MDNRFDTYFNYAQLTDRLAAIGSQYGEIMQVTALGKSYEGRVIPLVILTNRQSGADQEKPALWIDANIHATELTASMAALFLIEKLVTGYGHDPKITRILDEQTVYVVPRLNPDGAEWALANPPRFIRSGTRPYPLADRRDGLHSEDVDSDGRILQMRIPDPSGDWKISDRDPRLMIKRGPDEEGGAYYRLLTEGQLENYDGHVIVEAPPLQGLDFNRNFPGEWRPEGEQHGAGDFPGSEPEIRAVLEFFTGHRNVFGALTFHTYSRAILRPFGTQKDEDMNTDDLWVFEAIGERGTTITSYPCVSVYHHFRYHPKEVITGVFDDWLFSHKGIFAFTVEMWDLATAAGVKGKNDEKKFMDWFRKHPVDDDYKILDFVKEHANSGLVDWYPFQHPQLGAVELGGWNNLYTWRNPPPALLEAEIAPHADFAIAFASLAPHIAWHTVELTPLGNGLHRLLVVVENTGFLPTNGSNQAKKMKAVRPLRLELALPAGASLVSGKARLEIDHLEGRSNKMDVAYYGTSPTDNRAKVEWVIRAPEGGELTLTAIAERGGTIRRTARM